MTKKPREPQTLAYKRTFTALTEFMLWLSPVLDDENADDVDEAEECVRHFLAGGER